MLSNKKSNNHQNDSYLHLLPEGMFFLLLICLSVNHILNSNISTIESIKYKNRKVVNDIISIL